MTAGCLVLLPRTSSCSCGVHRSQVEGRMSSWIFDLTEAPRGETSYVPTGRHGKDGSPILRKVHQAPKIIAAGKCGVVTVSRWLADEGRWEAFTVDTPPVAWQPWPG